MTEQRIKELRGLEPREPMTHALKCWPEYYAAVENGEKPFEVRKWDRPYRVGDALLLKEYSPVDCAYTGRETMRRISYVLDMTYLPGDNVPHFAGYCVMGLESPEVARLTAELAAMTRERDAAVEDLESMMENAEEDCFYCGDKECYRKGGTQETCKPKWRGPVTAEGVKE